MGSKTKTRVIQCPVQNRLVEVTYKAIGNWFNSRYEVQSCPAMNDWGGCDRQCNSKLAISRKSAEWYSRY